MTRTVFFVSDSTGITAAALGHALLAQFDDVDFREVTIPFVADAGRAQQAVEEIDAAGRADGIRPIVFSTLTDPGIHDRVEECDALVLDMFSAFLRPLEIELNKGSIHAPGRFHGLVNRASYEGRIDAVDFAISHDDGASTRHYESADLILVGVSRTGKTPTSVYLAMQFGIKTANYPLTEDDLAGGELPPVLKEHRDLLFGLTIDAERLRQIRSERRPNSRYASLNQCRKEVTEGESLLRRARVTCLDTSNLSIEEIASRILQTTGLRRRHF